MDQQLFLEKKKQVLANVLLSHTQHELNAPKEDLREVYFKSQADTIAQLHEDLSLVADEDQYRRMSDEPSTCLGFWLGMTQQQFLLLTLSKYKLDTIKRIKWEIDHANKWGLDQIKAYQTNYFTAERKEIYPTRRHLYRFFKVLDLYCASNNPILYHIEPIDNEYAYIEILISLDRNP